MIPKVNLKLFFGILLMLILQVFLSPIIQINGILPNFIIAFCIAVACAQPNVPFMWFTCLGGILFDLICGTTVGTLSISLVVTIFFVTMILRKIEHPKAWIILIALVVSILFAESFYGAFHAVFGSNYSVFEIFTGRIIPCTLYDTIIALLIFPIASKLFVYIPIEEPVQSRMHRSEQ